MILIFIFCSSLIWGTVFYFAKQTSHWKYLHYFNIQSNPYDFALDLLNFFHALITAVGVTYTILYDTQLMKSILFSSSPQVDFWASFTIGYLIIDLFQVWNAKGYVWNIRREYFVYHCVIFFAFISYLVNQTAGYLVIFGLFGEYYTIWSNIKYLPIVYQSLWFKQRTQFIKLCDIILFVFTRNVLAWICLAGIVQDIFWSEAMNNWNWIMTLQLLFAGVFFTYNHFWLNDLIKDM
jgi:hypothetical protein